MTTPPDVEHVDAVVVGSTIRSLVAAYVLDRLGYRAVVLERSARLGGADGSFVTGGGTVFDHGLHVLDDRRSDLATRLFTHVIDGAVHRVTLRRAIALRGQLMPYAPAPSEMPSDVRSMLADRDLVDDIGDDPPTRERLAQCYGEAFTKLILDEVLPSYPTEARHLAFGVEKHRLLANIYPWFFPQARRLQSADESRAFHDLLRAGVGQDILYPDGGSFGCFARAFVDKLDPARVEVLTDVRSVHFEVQPSSHRVESVDAAGRRFRGDHYFWGEGWPALCQLLDVPCQDIATDRVMLGSFRLDRAPITEYHEILVGDPDLRINRIHFPAAFRCSDEPLMQIEFAVPLHDHHWTLDPDEWQARWLDDTRRLGILDERHSVEDFDFRSFVMHFNAYGAEGEALRDADPTLLHPDSNVRPIVPSMANLNLTRYVARAVRYVTAVLSS
jgi:glycine/D-amino acid oxidase-like deaminating enzyme